MIKMRFCDSNILYLDNASTTIPYKCDLPDDIWFNPSALYSIQIQEDFLKNCKEDIIQCVNMSKTGDVIFTSGATESNNLVIYSIINFFQKNYNGSQEIRVLLSPIEHPSVLNVFKHFEEEGVIKIDYFDVNEYGEIMIDTIEKKIYDNTCFCSCMYVNNEVGTIEPIEIIGDICKKNNILFHVDATQAIGKVPIDCVKSHIDFLTFSAHKFHGPKGVGAIVTKYDNLIKPLFFGGHQQRSKRPGTENLEGIYIMTQLLKKFCEIKEIKDSQITSFLCHKTIKNCLEHYFKPDEYIINSISNIIPIMNISFKNISGEYLVEELAKKNIYISTGSACTTGSLEYSHVLSAMNVSEDFIDGSIRLSFDNNEIQTNLLKDVIKKIYEIIKK